MDHDHQTLWFFKIRRDMPTVESETMAHEDQLQNYRLLYMVSFHISRIFKIKIYGSYTLYCELMK